MLLKLIVSVSILVLSFFYILCAEENKTTLAVLDFKSKHLSEGDIVALTNKISQDLFNTQKFAVVERDMVEEILKEQGFQQSVCSDTQCAVKLGKMLSVENICMGSIDKVGDNTVVSAKIVDVKTAKIEKMATAECENCTVTDIYKHTTRSVVDQLVSINEHVPTDDIKTVSYPEPVNIQKTTTTNSKVSLYIIPKLGLNISGIHGKYVDFNENDRSFNFSTKAGLAIGSGLKIVLHRMFALEPGIYFSMQGDSYTNDSAGLSYKERINFIELPINAQLLLAVNNLFTQYFFFAPMLNFRCSANTHGQNGYESDFTDITKAAEFALSFGTGSQFNVNKTILSLETRFKFGLTSLAKSSSYFERKTWNISCVLGTGFKVR